MAYSGGNPVSWHPPQARQCSCPAAMKACRVRHTSRPLSGTTFAGGISSISRFSNFPTRHGIKQLHADASPDCIGAGKRGGGKVRRRYKSVTIRRRGPLPQATLKAPGGFEGSAGGHPIQWRNGSASHAPALCLQPILTRATLQRSRNLRRLAGGFPLAPFGARQPCGRRDPETLPEVHKDHVPAQLVLSKSSPALEASK